MGVPSSGILVTLMAGADISLVHVVQAVPAC